MAANFEDAVKVILEHEGGFSNNVLDPGGMTNFGISFRFAMRNLSGRDFGHEGPIIADDIVRMTREKASEIYRRFWWDMYGYYKIDDQRVATKVLDMSVNMGAVQAHKLLQRAAKRFHSDVLEDGILGPTTISAVNTIPPENLLLEVCGQQKQYYIDLAKAKPSLQIFLKGWLKRANWPY